MTPSKGCPNAPNTLIAATVYAAMPISTVGANGRRTQGFDATLNPTGTQIIVKGYYDNNGTQHNIDWPTYEGNGSKADPKITYTKAYTYTVGGNADSPPAVTGSTLLVFSFAPNDVDGDMTLAGIQELVPVSPYTHSRPPRISVRRVCHGGHRGSSVPMSRLYLWPGSSRPRGPPPDESSLQPP